MFEYIGKGLSRQLSEIFELHFVKEEEKSEERKKKEKQIKLLIDLFTKALNLIVYFMLIIVIMRIASILVLNPSQGIYEARKIAAENERRKISPMADTLSIKNDIIKMKSDSLRITIANLKGKEDSILRLKDEIAILKANGGNNNGLDLIPIQSAGVVIKFKQENSSKFSDKSGSEQADVGKTAMQIPSAVVDLNYGENYSLWKQIRTKFPSVLQMSVIAVILLILLWLMKMIMKFFYFIGNLISPFSIVKVIGLYTFIYWILTNTYHLFAVSSLFTITERIIPHIK